MVRKRKGTFGSPVGDELCANCGGQTFQLFVPEGSAAAGEVAKQLIRDTRLWGRLLWPELDRICQTANLLA